MKECNCNWFSTPLSSWFEISSTDCSRMQWGSQEDGAYGRNAHHFPSVGLPRGESHSPHLGIPLACEERGNDETHLEGERRQTHLRQENIQTHLVFLPFHRPASSYKEKEVNIHVALDLCM